MFKKIISPFKNKLLEIQYGNLVNENNICSISRYRIWKIFKDEEFHIINIYLHNVIDKWIKNQIVQNDSFYKNLKKIIRKTSIELNEVEKHNLLLLEERVFSIDRHIKDMDVNIKLESKENVGAKFVNAKIYKKIRKKLITSYSGNLLISNKRLILEETKNIFIVPFEDILSFAFLKYGFNFTTRIGRVYVIRIHDQITLNNTLRNIFHKKIPQILNKEEKPALLKDI